MKKKKFEQDKIECMRSLQEARKSFVVGLWELEDLLALPDDTTLSAIREKLEDAKMDCDTCNGILGTLDNDLWSLWETMEARTLLGRLKRLFKARKR